MKNKLEKLIKLVVGSKLPTSFVIRQGHTVGIMSSLVSMSVQMLNKFIAKLVRYLRQFYVDVEINYWLNSQNKFIDGHGRPSTMDTALLDCIRACQNQGIYRANDHIHQFRKLLNKREKGVVFIREDGINYTVYIDFVRIG